VQDAGGDEREPEQDARHSYREYERPAPAG
jgi:hypothetical protein